MTFAARIAPSLLESLVRLDDEQTSIAELCRCVGAEAERQGLTRPSYERVRELVHEIRRLRVLPRSTRALVAEIVFRDPRRTIPKSPIPARHHRTPRSVPRRSGSTESVVIRALGAVLRVRDALRRILRRRRRPRD